MSDNESESSCVSALEDPSLGCTTPEDPKSRSNLPDDDQTDPRSISESTSQSYQGKSGRMPYNSMAWFQ